MDKERLFAVSILLLIVVITSGCGTVKRGSVSAPVQQGSEATLPSESQPAAFALSTSGGNSMVRVMQQLHSAHTEWEGTPYRLGGSGMNGIDCSAFTQVVFREYFGKNLPRNTRQQLGEGDGVRRRGIRPGDLIFFRTGRRTLHVGIAMEGGDFLHASVSGGVTISNLAESYWGGKFLGVRRVL
ncbi:MAG: NlpC/P60 family protein [Balneolaceae bacterium]|nr:NlpC/P60 family protein [Balneolaceae bacterium]